MKNIKFGLLLVVLLAGCALNQYQSDVGDNQYSEKQIHEDPSAAYVGEWTAATNVGVRSIKIEEKGRIKVCLSPSYGTANGKVYMDNGTPTFILETGAKVNIVSVDKESLWLKIYGKQEQYYAGLVPDECATVFMNIK